MKFQNVIRIGLVASTFCAAGSADATENGLAGYPIGASTVIDGVLPPPGDTWFQDYTLYTSDHAFNNGSGNNMVPGFHSEIGANAPRILHTWDFKLGPFALASGLGLRLVYVDSSNAFTGNSHQVGMADPILEPLYLGWSNPEHTFFAYGGVDVTMPSFSNVSTNYYSVQPALNMTWMPTHDWEFDIAALAEFHSPNDKTGYHSGTLLISDWAALYRVFASVPQMKIGLNGYAVKQVTNDTLHGFTVGDGFKQQGFAMGPELTYAFKSGEGIAVKWQHDFVAKYRTKGDTIWVEFNVPFHSEHKPGDPT